MCWIVHQAHRQEIEAENLNQKEFQEQEAAQAEQAFWFDRTSKEKDGKRLSEQWDPASPKDSHWRQQKWAEKQAPNP